MSELTLSYVFNLFLLCSVSEVIMATTVYINSEESKESSCSAKNHISSYILCSSLEKAFELAHNQSNLTLIIDSDLDLKQVLHFDGVQNLSIIGSTPSNSSSLFTVTCVGSSGVFVTNVKYYTMTNLIISNCGFKKKDKYVGGVILWESSNVAINRVHIHSSNYTGLILFNCNGSNSVKSSNFTRNQYQSYSMDHSSSDILPEAQQDNSSEKYSQYSKTGGGMSVTLTLRFSDSHTEIDNCIFYNNAAKWGGGLFIVLNDNVKNNTITIKSSEFLYNTAYKEGGAIRMNFEMNSSEATTNKIFVENTTFEENSATYGGGVGIITSYNTYRYPEKSNFIFKNCTWAHNVAHKMSPAVDIASSARYNSEKFGFLPSPIFEDIAVYDNHVRSSDSLMRYSYQNDGVFVVTSMKVYLSGNIFFRNNSPTALKAVSGGFVVEHNTSLYFYNNSGYNGAAIALNGFSFVRFFDDILISFINNVARNKGAAIFYSGIDQHDFFTGTYCFLERERSDNPPVNSTFIFQDNVAEYGRWIYAGNVMGCASRCNSNSDRTFDSVFKCTGKFRFLNGSKFALGNNLVRTSGRKFHFFDNHTSYPSIPGSKVRINYKIEDDFGVTLSPLVYVSVPLSNKAIDFDRRYTLSNYFYPNGQPNHSTVVDVTVDGIRGLNFKFMLELLNCPPGFVYINTSKSCECGNTKEHGFYQPIFECRKDTYQALMDKQYWAGYIPEDSEDYRDLYFMPCYSPICRYNATLLDNSTQNLSRTICGDARSGIMCGKCHKNYTVFYHSKSYRCYKDKFCNYGPLFYVLSELLPVLVVFVLIVKYDFTFTSGSMVGFIFFCQYLEGTNIYSGTGLSYLRAPYVLFYGIFNLDYFSIEKLSFCLWKDFHIQEIILVKYVTISFAFILVVIQILVLKTNLFSRISTRCKVDNKKSFIHGLSAFLVICYIQATKTSLLLLKHVVPEGLNGVRGQVYTYYGGQPFFQGRHIIYSILAVFFLSTITILPLLILLLHPIVLQLLYLCKLGEHWVVVRSLNIIGIQKLMPFLDCFQSCYKDKWRFFAGLYLAYRVALLLCFIVAKSYTTVLKGMQFLLLSFLGIHSVIQPYKNKWHNIIDSLVFTNLAVINMLSIIVETSSKYSNTHTVQFTAEAIQIVLFYLPMLVFIAYVMLKIYFYYRSKRSNEDNAMDDLLEDDRIVNDAQYESLSQRLTSNVCDHNTYSM